MLEEIKDPKILKKLNSPVYEEITDKDVLSKLNEPFSKPDVNLPNYPFVTRPITPKESTEVSKNIKEGSLGALQNFINTPEQIANVFGGHLYNKYDFAPKTKAAEVGGYGGDIGSFFLPGSAFSIGAKGLSYIPKVNTLLESGKAALEARPIANLLTKMGRSGAEAGLFQKAKAPESNLSDVTKATALGTGLSALGNAISATNPLLSSVSKILLGSLLGYHYGGVKGIPVGITGSFMAPRMFKETGYTREPVATEVLTQQPNPLAHETYLAGQRIGDVPTPAETFNHPLMGARQGAIGRTEQGAESMAQFGEQRLANQQNAINNLLEEIFPRATHHQDFISDLYKKSFQHNLTDAEVKNLRADPVIDQAFKKVENDPVYQKYLKDIPQNNYAYLNQVKIALNDMEQASLGKFNEQTNTSRIYKNTARELTNMMDENAPIYKVARHHSNMEIIRKNVENRLGKKAITGSNFYKEFLSNDNKFNELLDDLSHNPQAKETLIDMRRAWKNLIDYDTAKSAAAMSQRHTSSAREGFQKFWNEYKESLGSPRDVERAKFIHNPNWWEHFDEVMRYKNLKLRAEKLADLITRGVSAGTLEYSKETAPKNR